MRTVSARLRATLAGLVALLLLAAPVASATTRSTPPRPAAAQGAQIVRLFEHVDRNTLTLSTRAFLHAHDHFGGVVDDTARHRLVTLNWGSREAYSWRIPPRPLLSGFAPPLSMIANPSHFVDYQDCKYLGRVPEQRH